MVEQHYRWDFIGLSTDTKPTPETSEKVVDGSTFYCSDNSKLYVFCKDTWYEKTVSGGGGTSYTAGDGIDITNDIISTTNTGKARELTSADYNWPTANPDGFAVWKFSPGMYYFNSSNAEKFYTKESSWVNTKRASFVVMSMDDTFYKTGVVFVSSAGTPLYQEYISSSNSARWADPIPVAVPVLDGLTYTSATASLSAKQGKVLKDLIDSLAIKNAGAPTTSTVGTVGQLLEDTTNGKLYICTAVTPGTDPDPDTYTWTEVGAGASITPVQTTGTSTTDVMSQNATTSMVFADPGTKAKVQIGLSANASGSVQAVAVGAQSKASGQQATAVGPSAFATDRDAVGIGNNAYANAQGAVALGANSRATHQGEVGIGLASASSVDGYNNSAYRLISGLYDGQSNHDAATVAQGNKLMSAAPTTTDAGVLGQLWTDTTNMHTYQCTAISGSTYTWTQRW